MTLEVARWERAEVGGRAARPLATARGVWQERRGVLIRLWDGDGRRGVGEASPLPGYSPDDLSGAARALEAALAKPIPLAMDDVVQSIAKASSRISPDQPAARFALETALFDLAGRTLGVPVRDLLARGRPLDHLPPHLPLAALIETRTDAERAAARGFRTFKVKIGRRPFTEELAALKDLRAALPPGAALRLDANRALDPAVAPERLAALAPLSPELVEEPCGDLTALTETPVPIAADESLVDGAPEALAGSCAAFILKPALLGGLLRCVELAAIAHRRGLDVVVTHLFDGPVALAACAELALSLAPARACGLAPHAGLAAYPPLDVPQIRGAHLKPNVRAGLGLDPVAFDSTQRAAAGKAAP